MKKQRFTEEQIVRILREAEQGKMPQKDICKKHAVSEQTFYRWKATAGFATNASTKIGFATAARLQ